MVIFSKIGVMTPDSCINSSKKKMPVTGSATVPNSYIKLMAEIVMKFNTVLD